VQETAEEDMTLLTKENVDQRQNTLDLIKQYT
jgi:hypothetical protein